MSSDLGLTYLGQIVNKLLVSACYVCLHIHTSFSLAHATYGPFCFTSTEVRWFIRDGGGGGGGGGGGRGRKNEGLTTDTARKRPERLWTTARTMEVLRRCPLTIA